MVKTKEVVGWREWIQLPNLLKTPIKAKIDTGARTSALHAYNIKIFKKNGKKYASFEIHPIQRSTDKIKKVTARVVEHRKVKSSIGHETERPVIKTDLKIGSHTYEIELTLVNRDVMGFRMLIGRQAMKSRFLVDPGKSFLVGKKS